jgi:hypothetical protein
MTTLHVEDIEVLQALPGTLLRCTLFKTSWPTVVGTLSTAETQYNTTSMEGLMGLLSGFNVTLLEIEMLGQAARAAFSGAAIPSGSCIRHRQVHGRKLRRLATT